MVAIPFLLYSFLSLGRWLGMSSDLLVIAFLAVAVTLPLIYGGKKETLHGVKSRST